MEEISDFYTELYDNIISYITVIQPYSHLSKFSAYYDSQFPVGIDYILREVDRLQPQTPFSR